MFGNDDGLKRFTTPPAEPAAEVTNTEPAAQSTEPVVQATTEAAPVQPTTSETKPDEFIENLNKKYGTQFKADDDVKSVFELPKKVTEYESKLKEAEGWKKQNEEYQKQIEEIKNAGNSEFLSKPLVQKAYVAEQLLAKYPDKDPFVLQEIAMTDVSKLSDLDALVKNEKMDLPDASEADIKSHFLDKYGIDPDTPPAEWSSVAKTRMAIDAKSARANIRSLTNGIELPKAVSKEEREKLAAETLQKRMQAAEPFKSKFTQFDKFKSGDFEWDVPSDYKSGLEDMYKAMVIDAGLEPTEENLQSATEIRDSLFLLQNFPKIKEAIAKQAQVELQKKLDEALNNTTKPNTATASDDNANREELPGPSLSQAFTKW